MTVPVDARILPTADVSRARVFINRFLFRGMLFTMGVIAVALYRLVPDKNVAWRFAKAQARNLCRLCGVHVHVRGIERLGRGPYVFTPNHQSHFDIAALLGYLPGNNRFATKKELFRQPVLGTVLRTLGMIPVDRENPNARTTLLEQIRRTGFSTIIFPEGTRSHDGRLLPFRKGAFVTAIELGLPVVPVVCKGTRQVMPKGRYLSIFPGEVEIMILDPIATSEMTYDDRDGLSGLVRELIGDELAKPYSAAVSSGSA